MESLNCESMMIGDWVLYDPNVFIEDEYEPTKACYPTKIGIGADLDLADEGCYAPISLTPEILEKNEFEKALDGDNTECYRYYCSAADGYIKITLWDGGDSVWSLEVVNYEKFDNNEIVYKNNFTFLKVHQLQHVLRLCNIDKEIVL